MAQLLVHYGADVNTKNRSGWAPIHAAAGRGHLAMTAWLLDQQADPTVTVNQRNAFFLAIQAGQLETMRELGQHCPDLLLTKDEEGWTPLLSAMAYRHNHLIPTLIELGAKTTEICKELTCLQHAIIEGCVEDVNLSFEFYAAINKARSCSTKFIEGFFGW